MYRRALNGIRTTQASNWSPITRSVHVEAKVAALGLELPAPAVPKGNFVNYVVVGNIAYLSGHLPQVLCAFIYYLPARICEVFLLYFT